MKEDTPNAGQREVETRRIGLQNKLAEKCVDAKLDNKAQADALSDLENSTGQGDKK